MHRLVVNPGTENAWEIPLQGGVVSLGRNAENDYPIEHESVSSRHCQVLLKDGAAVIKDLGSTSGTFVDDALVEETVLHPGQTIRLGDIALRYEADASPALEPPSSTGERPLTVNAYCKYHPKTLARFLCPECHAAFCDLCVSIRQEHGRSRIFCRACTVECTPLKQAPIEPEREQSFARQALGAFKYPLNEDGALLLIAGGVFFLLLDAAKFPLRYVPGYGWVLIALLTIFGVGYLTAYLRRILTASANGEDALPDWPEFSDFGELASIFLQLVGTVAFSFLPAIGLTIYAVTATQGGAWLGWATTACIIFGCVYFPMAFMAVAMFDSIGAVNPLLIVPSIVKIPWEYFLTIALLVAIFIVRRLGEAFLPAVLPIPILPSILTSILGLYLLIIEMRILGLLYWTRQDELGWFKS